MAFGGKPPTIMPAMGLFATVRLDFVSIGVQQAKGRKYARANTHTHMHALCTLYGSLH